MCDGTFWGFYVKLIAFAFFSHEDYCTGRKVSDDFHSLLSGEKKIYLKDFSGASFAQNLVKIKLFTKRPLVIVVEDQKRADVLEDELNFFSHFSRVQILSGYDVLPYYGLSPNRKALLEYQKTLHELLTKKIDYLIVTKWALLKRVMPRECFESLTLQLVQDDLVERDGLIRDLLMMGYERVSVVEEPGEFAVRGDLIDVFSPHRTDPFRVSLFDIEIESIKAFDHVSQRTKESLHQVFVIPAREIFLCGDGSHSNGNEIKSFNDLWKTDLKKRADKKEIPKSKRDQIEEWIGNKIYFHGIEFFLSLFYQNLDTLFDYLSPDTVLVSDLEDSLTVASRDVLQQLTKHHAESEHVESIFSPEEIYITENESAAFLEKFFCIEHVDLGRLNLSKEIPVLFGETQSNLELKTKIASKITKIHSLAPLASELNQKRHEGIHCCIVCQNDLQLDRVKDLLNRFELPIKVIAKEEQEVMISNLTQANHSDLESTQRLVYLFVGTLHEGFFSKKERQWWLTDEEIFGKKTRRASRQKQQTAVFSSFADLVDGDFIVHMDHGIGVYRGLTKLDLDVNQNDFLLIEYLGEDKLYVPIDKLNRVQRFIAAEGSSPHLDKLGGTTWIKTKQKAKRAARKLAKELLDIQAKRETLVGHAFGSNVEMMDEFAAGFEFEETPDQLQAIQDVMLNMESTRPMDRLICGDVGYGKTEVALRAAFKAIVDQKQVAVLVPTTVLAFQHFLTFSQRLKSYGVTVELLSRFRSLAEQKAVVKKIKEGVVDVVVGTHRLLSRDIQFSQLGLLVVDEEHRFGVIHKEKIKKLRSLVDVITLTATPIPRTLNFALNGIRDLSIINTPPVDRLAIKTYTCYFDEVTVRDAILKELRRGGQIFFVHNRVQSIEKMSQKIAELIPEARVRFGHGQMAEDDLEDIMIDFVDHKFDVLVCTTIIESGLDIPNANTMIIHRADYFGLAQLYQLRGRVGRSHHQAYCYLIIPTEELLTAKAKRRLAVIQKFTALGSGFKIASHDLEIRGAGNILGDEQSGHIAAIGYDLYVHLLQEAVNELKNKNVPEEFEPELKLNMPAKIPDHFISDTQLRLTLYKQVSSVESLEQVDDIANEWNDRFGKLPEEVLNLMGLIKIKILCQKVLVSQLRQSGDKLFYTFHQMHSLDPKLFLEAIQRHPKKFSISRDGQFIVNQKFNSPQLMIQSVLDFLGVLAGSLDLGKD